MGQIIVTALIVIAILFIVFLILRELVCWYWKINEGLQLLKQHHQLLASIDTSLKKISKSVMTDEEKTRLKKSPDQLTNEEKAKLYDDSNN